MQRRGWASPRIVGRATRLRGPLVAVEAGEELVEVVAAEGPVEWFGDGVVTLLEGGESVTDLVEVGEVVGVDDLALNNGQVDLALVQPRGVQGSVDEPQGRPLAL